MRYFLLVENILFSRGIFSCAIFFKCSWDPRERISGDGIPGMDPGDAPLRRTSGEGPPGRNPGDRLRYEKVGDTRLLA